MRKKKCHREMARKNLPTSLKSFETRGRVDRGIRVHGGQESFVLWKEWSSRKFFFTSSVFAIALAKVYPRLFNFPCSFLFLFYVRT